MFDPVVANELVFIEAPPAFKANDAVIALLAQLAVPNKLPVIVGAFKLPVIATDPDISRVAFRGPSLPIPTKD